MKTKKMREYISQLDNLLPVLIKHLQISDPNKLFGINITLRQYLALDILVGKGKCMITELSRSLGVALNTMTELVNRLVKKRFVEKSSDMKDRRIVWVSLTGEGLKIIQRINERKQEHISAILERVSQRDRQILIDILKIVSQVMRKVEMDSLKA
ncbi:MAG: hypothetical protein DDT31_00977 [Syntrophomonadaceae bacterium]|nr:hypothetical protein [Bacillota bacterium]